MRSNGTKGLLTKMFLVVSLLFGVVSFAATPADAQYRHRHSRGRVIVRPRVYWGNPYWGNPYWNNRVYFAPSSRVTEGQGYRDGLNDGRDDAKHNKGYNPSRHHDYRDGQTSAYLDAYSQGYAEGYNQRIG